IAVITSATNALKETRDLSLPWVPWAMVDEIQEATRRLNRVVTNLLDLTRLESGYVKPNLDWCDVEDLIHVTLKEIERDLLRYKVTPEIAKGIPLVRLDFVLMQQVLTNLLHQTDLREAARFVLVYQLQSLRRFPTKQSLE
ncbi:MAG: two-component system sensor histidine kinase KdpD, partial [Verrucomicrobiales bacterium]|nr:two-component system sensor histidine kinase KdpD [Verrucomicrobiales bacterium]